ncbi:4-hydroxybenzoate solanesyltransferase [Merismopedia glauca]|uniref:4-hydroxybenzoate solanesyltransferase n=1 Tax=Merismopedia glauca CCAP 1448/3 TaxID=1296344 RepID=A0A2T1C2X2_9CYAN|nr:4-hydroxybenzoate solanesyltransferase [Merismopedia glauca]PSB02611.1 4-hydroxybenzoate octaprenyltransferase [Merismopedia glauca CCAP 1448/3]
MLTQPTSASEPTWYTVFRLLRWHKPEGRLILMIPALWALFLAAQAHPPLPLLGTIVVGTLATSAAGCVINDLWDRDIDPQVARTSDRPLASRALSVKTGIVVFFISLICAGILSLYLNQLTFWLCVAAVPVIILYPLAKRVFPIPQLVLSIAWGFAVLISWTAVTGKLESATWLLWGATVLWTLGFDTVYAMADREDDSLVGINSSALFFGKYVAEAIALFYLGTAVLLGYLAVQLQLSWAFWLSLAVAVGFWGWGYLRLRQTNLPAASYGQMFRENVWIGFILLAGMILGLLVK